MKKRAKLLLGLSLIATIFCGCEPEETYVLVDASELSKAVDGELGFAKIEMVFKVDNDDDPNLPNKIRTVALRHLGEGAVVDIEKTKKKRIRETGSIRDYDREVVQEGVENAKIVARFKIPVGNSTVINNADACVMCLEYVPSKKMFQLVPGRAVKYLNSDLAEIDYSIDFSYTGGNYSGISFNDNNLGTTISIVDKAPLVNSPLLISVAAVKVNGKKVMYDTYKVGEDSSIKINYNSEFYEGFAPCFQLSDNYKEVSSKKLSEEY